MDDICKNKAITKKNIVRDLQIKSLEILRYFDCFCSKYKLKYYLGGGCLIGAVRHHGFIPWDDDIDLFMPRHDYERLTEIWNLYADTNKYKFCRTDYLHNYHDGGASIRDVNTTCINRHSVDEDICHGIAIEIMPLDGCPKSHILRTIQLFWAFTFSLFNVQRLPDNKGRFIRWLTSVIYSVIQSKKPRYKIWRFAEKQMSKYSWNDCEEITELIGAIHGMLLRHKKSDFEDTVLLDFENYKFPVMLGYKTYLRRIWGDYMQLPPEDKRVVKHDIVHFSASESYENFKGKYYCVDNK